MAVKGATKDWKLLGTGMNDGDLAKWVDFNTTTDEMCGEGSANAVEIEGEGVADNMLTIIAKGNGAFKFMQASPEGRPHT